jgi:hypothetical protein
VSVGNSQSSASHSATNELIDARSARSSGATRTCRLPVAAAISEAMRCLVSALRAARVTSAPVVASARAVSTPMPEALPVTMIRLPPKVDARDDFRGGGLRAERGGNGRGRCHDRLPCQYPSRCGKPNEAMTHPSQTLGSLGGYCAQTSVECAATPLLLKNSLAQLPQWVAICS